MVTDRVDCDRRLQCRASEVDLVEAQAENEKLRHEINKLRATREYWPHNAEADAVIKYRDEQLVEANATIDRLKEAYGVAVKIVSEQGAELSKVKSALIRVIDAYVAGDEAQHIRMIEIAREALGFRDE